MIDKIITPDIVKKIDEWHQRLGLTNEDIKSLESYLIKSAIFFDVQHKYEENGETFTIAWMKHGKHKRLVNVSSENVKPLLECPLEVRLHGYKQLPALIEAIGNHLDTILPELKIKEIQK